MVYFIFNSGIVFSGSVFLKFKINIYRAFEAYASFFQFFFSGIVILCSGCFVSARGLVLPFFFSLPIIVE